MQGPMVVKKQFSIFYILCYRKGIFDCFLAEKGLGPLGVKGTKKLKGLIAENCRCLKHDVQPLDTSVIRDIQQK